MTVHNKMSKITQGDVLIDTSTLQMNFMTTIVLCTKNFAMLINSKQQYTNVI